ncbi:hypothetical protein PR048_003099 [Dryococelus australis]|uniref:Uncharacterized protein n=1 Tax=Dryococelus australis TaxID=614101 RepID=A0ABQ9IM82_9NEOP|nr:hypothetical protein PR048_003099 [Dryococelus australis]
MTPLSDYLQTKKSDYAQAWRLVSTAQNQLEKARSQFDQMFRAAKMFLSVMMSRLLDEKIESQRQKIFIWSWNYHPRELGRLRKCQESWQMTKKQQ